ncbi:MAG: 4-hydroxythreonine-4-phosphate dehydrogenase PdxA [Alphaproteobacteria bacterium]|nr:4-hydroxythreonine-4-phosphate dehydrogenase PdxA [Alphaproteobacteria bacterium]
MTRPLLISGGEPAGIAPEIIAAAWQHYRNKALPFAVIGDADLLARRGAIPTHVIADPGAASTVFASALPVLDYPLAKSVSPGTPEVANAKVVIDAIAYGVACCQNGRARGLVSAPIDKSVLRRGGFIHQGHTDYLQHLDRQHLQRPATAVMMLASPRLRCVPVTVHLALREAIASLSKASIQETINVVANALQTYWQIKNPRIAVSGLNPHAGESGQMGDEEIRLIAPALHELQQQRPDIKLSAPLSADSLFTPNMRASYNAFITMTHDQALIPIKTLSFDETVNITLGLSFVRTSPDHGTAYDLAGSNRANPNSMIAAINEAWRMSAT